MNFKPLENEKQYKNTNNMCQNGTMSGKVDKL